MIDNNFQFEIWYATCKAGPGSQQQRKYCSYLSGTNKKQKGKIIPICKKCYGKTVLHPLVLFQFPFIITIFNLVKKGKAYSRRYSNFYKTRIQNRLKSESRSWFWPKLTDSAVLVEELRLRLKDSHYFILISNMVQSGSPIFEIILSTQNSDLDSSKIKPILEIHRQCRDSTRDISDKLH